MELLCYLDPSAISVLVTSLTAAFVAVAASVVIYWRKLKNKLKKNSDKEQAEEDIRMLDESALEGEAEQPTEAKEEQPAEAEQPTEVEEQPAESEKPKKTAKSKKKE